MYSKSCGGSTNKLRPTPRMSSFDVYLIFGHMTTIIMSIQGPYLILQHHRLKMRMDTSICMAESLRSSPETIRTWLISYIPIQNVLGV